MRLSPQAHAALAALLSVLPLATSASTVWTTSSTEKLRPSAAARSTASIALAAARNEFEAAQIAITAGGSAIQGVRATASPLTGPGGTLPAPRLFREAVITLGQASAPDGAAGDWFDALIPDVDDVVGEQRNAFPFDVPASSTRVIWLELLVPQNAAAGVYTGSVTLTAGGAALGTVPISFTVRPFTLPSTSSLRSYFGLYYGELPARHGVSGNDFYALRARYAQLALDHRFSVSGFDDGDHTLPHLQTWYGALVDGTAPTQLPGAKLTSVEYVGDRSTSSYASWASFFRGKGWFDRLFDYTCDEPPATCAWSDIPARNAAMKAADPEFRSLVTTSVQDATAQGVLSSIDLIVPVVNYLDGKGAADPGGWDDQYTGPQVSKYGTFLAGARKELWSYQSCMSHGCGGTSTYFTGWPSYMIDASAVRARMQEWLSFLWGATGELYWDVTFAYGAGDPWTNQYQFSGNGDGTLFYPGTPDKIGGTTHIPVASLRMKMLRAGMQDYEYLKLLASVGDPALARSIATGLLVDAFTPPTADALLAAREQIAARIVELTGGTDPGASTGGGSGSGSGSGSGGSGSGGGGGAAGGGAGGSTDGSGRGAGQTVPDTKLGGCSAGRGSAEFAALGLAAALLVRRRRKVHAR